MKISITILLAITQISVFSQTITEAWVKEHYTKKEYSIIMRDGVKLLVHSLLNLIFEIKTIF